MAVLVGVLLAWPHVRDSEIIALTRWVSRHACWSRLRCALTGASPRTLTYGLGPAAFRGCADEATLLASQASFQIQRAFR